MDGKIIVSRDFTRILEPTCCNNPKSHWHPDEDNPTNRTTASKPAKKVNFDTTNVKLHVFQNWIEPNGLPPYEYDPDHDLPGKGDSAGREHMSEMEANAAALYVTHQTKTHSKLSAFDRGKFNAEVVQVPSAYKSTPLEQLIVKRALNRFLEVATSPASMTFTADRASLGPHRDNARNLELLEAISFGLESNRENMFRQSRDERKAKREVLRQKSEREQMRQREYKGRLLAMDPAEGSHYPPPRQVHYNLDGSAYYYYDTRDTYHPAPDGRAEMCPKEMRPTLHEMIEAQNQVRLQEIEQAKLERAMEERRRKEREQTLFGGRKGPQALFVRESRPNQIYDPYFCVERAPIGRNDASRFRKMGE